MLESEDCLWNAVDENDESFNAFNLFHGFLLFDQRRERASGCDSDNNYNAFVKRSFAWVSV